MTLPRTWRQSKAHLQFASPSASAADVLHEHRRDRPSSNRQTLRSRWSAAPRSPRRPTAQRGRAKHPSCARNAPLRSDLGRSRWPLQAQRKNLTFYYKTLAGWLHRGEILQGEFPLPFLNLFRCVKLTSQQSRGFSCYIPPSQPTPFGSSRSASGAKPLLGTMRAALVLLSLSSAAAFGGGKVIAGCLDTRATNYNTPGPVTLNVSEMCLYAPQPPAPPSTPGRYGRVSALSGSNRFQSPARLLPLIPSSRLHCRPSPSPLSMRRARESAAPMTTTAGAGSARRASVMVGGTPVASGEALGRIRVALAPLAIEIHSRELVSCTRRAGQRQRPLRWKPN